MKKKDNYLVIGNKGFIGSRLVKYLKKKIIKFIIRSLHLIVTKAQMLFIA